MGQETSAMIEAVFEPQKDVDSCAPTVVRWSIKAGLQLNKQDPNLAPSQSEIGQAIYSWKRFQLHLQPLRFLINDNWCLPETISGFLTQYFRQGGFSEGEQNNLERLSDLLDQGFGLIALFQDIFPDKNYPQGYKNSGDNGHYVMIVAVDRERGLIKLADPSRLKEGNQRFFDQDGVVAVTASQAAEPGRHLELKSHYWVEADKFMALWHEQRFNKREGKYVRPLIAVKLDSLR